MLIENTEFCSLLLQLTLWIQFLLTSRSLSCLTPVTPPEPFLFGLNNATVLKINQKTPSLNHFHFFHFLIHVISSSFNTEGVYRNKQYDQCKHYCFSHWWQLKSSLPCPLKISTRNLTVSCYPISDTTPGPHAYMVSSKPMALGKSEE